MTSLSVLCCIQGKVEEGEKAGQLISVWMGRNGKEEGKVGGTREGKWGERKIIEVKRKEGKGKALQEQEKWVKSCREGKERSGDGGKEGEERKIY